VEKVGRVRRGAFVLLAAPLVLATGWRVASLEAKLPFGELIPALRARRARPLPGWLANPAGLSETVEKLLAVLPPQRCGDCLRRALILLELWSRCGLAPTLHLGFRLEAPERDGHAWLTAETAAGERLQASGPLDYRPAFEL
jgi:hypothetical protein